jgi:hypothetical protein
VGPRAEGHRGGKGLAGRADAVLLRKAAGQLGLTAGLSAALRRKGSSPLMDRGTVLASLAVAIALGATSMSDIALLSHLSPVLGPAPSGPTARRALDLAGTPRMLDRVARRKEQRPRGRPATASTRWAPGARTPASPCMLLRPGNADSNTFTDHETGRAGSPVRPRASR